MLYKGNATYLRHITKEEGLCRHSENSEIDSGVEVESQSGDLNQLVLKYKSTFQDKLYFQVIITSLMNSLTPEQNSIVQLLLADLSSPEAPVCRGAPAGPVPEPAHHVRIPPLPAPHSESGGADPTLWRHRLQNSAAGRHLHREVQWQKARGLPGAVRAVGAR